MSRSSIAIVTVLGIAALSAAMAGRENPQKKPSGTVVVLTKRTDNGAYGTSAYSFRLATQDVAVHKNEVDLVFNGCGLIHVSPHGGLENKVARVDARSLADPIALPSEGWMSSSFVPEKDATYVMEVEDGSTRMRIKFRVTAASGSKVELEWMPYADPGRGVSGTMGQCDGKHGGG